MDSLFYFGQDKCNTIQVFKSSKKFARPSFQVFPGVHKVNNSDKVLSITKGLCLSFSTDQC